MGNIEKLSKLQKTVLISVMILGSFIAVLVTRPTTQGDLDLKQVNASVLDEKVIVVPASFGKVVNGGGSDRGRYIITFENGFVTGYFQGTYRIVWEES